MKSYLNFTLIVRPHRCWGEIYFLSADNNVIRQRYASEQLYSGSVKMTTKPNDGIEYRESIMSITRFESLSNAWKEISRLTIAELSRFQTDKGTGGTAYTLQVKGRSVSTTLEWVKVGEVTTPFDLFINTILANNSCHTTSYKAQ